MESNSRLSNRAASRGEKGEYDVSYGFRDSGVLRSLPFESADDGGRVLEQNTHPGQAIGALPGPKMY